METTLEITSIVKFALLSDVETGTWFYYFMPDGSKVLAIKGDDTVYKGTKTICMRVEPLCGTLARVNNNLHIEAVKNVTLTL